MATNLNAADPASWLSTLWEALDALEDCNADMQAEGRETYGPDRDDICTAMAWVREALGLPSEVEGLTMATVWIVQGEHWNVPGIAMTAHASLDAANAKAAELVSAMLDDTGDVEGKPRRATEQDWAGVPMGWLQDYHGPCWVDVCELPVEA